jgi:Mn-dependent DtxR family transcriptional regulator
MRILEGKVTFTSKDVARWMEISVPQACKYINELQVEHKIVFSHKDAHQIFYKVIRT